jgi:hypothetical protein
METTKCPVCGRVCAEPTIIPSEMHVDCPRCGRYSTDGRFAAVQAHPEFPRLRMYLSAHLRQANERNELVRVAFDTWKTFAEGHAHTSVSRKLDMLLQLFCRRAVTGGQTVSLNVEDDFVLVDASGEVEMNWLTETLLEQKALESHGVSGSYVVTAKGWERNSPMDAGGVPGTCFVAMSFAEAFDPIYEVGIKPAIEASGLTVINVGKMEHNEVVTDVIHAEIRRAQVIVADVTSQRPNVYFEAGLALGLRRIVIWSCCVDEIEKVHFDTRQYSHVVWKDAADLRVKLEARIRGTIAIPVKQHDAR